MWRLATAVAAISMAGATANGDAGESVFRERDLVVWLGAAFIEQDQASGHVETLLTMQHPGIDLRFRNLGWSGDTVYAHARSYFDGRSFTEKWTENPPEEGFERLRAQLTDLKPSLVVCCYGAVAAFDGEAGLPVFRKGYARLLDMVRDSTGARVTLVSPPPFENLGPPLPDHGETNRVLGLCRDIARELAKDRGLGWADLFAALGEGHKASGDGPLTNNGLHFHEAGYARAAPVLAELLGCPPAPVTVDADVALGEIAFGEASAREIELRPDSIRFELTATALPGSPMGGVARRLRVRSLHPGNYRVMIDGADLMTVTAEHLARGVEVATGPEFDQAERLRQVVVEKNRLYFHRWRPQNETYLFGFRKHEQGQNAAEIPQFDPLVREREAFIAGLNRPRTHRWVVEPAPR